MRLRRAREEDRALLLRVYASTRDDLAAIPLTAEARDALVEQQFAAQDAYYRENYSGATFDVVTDGGADVGRLYVARSDGEIRIVDIALLPEARGRGIGSALVQALIKESERAGKPLTVHVERQNRALAWYERLGFRATEDKGVYLFLQRGVEAQANTAS